MCCCWRAERSHSGGRALPAPERHRTASAAETGQLAGEIARTLKPGDVVLLSGEMGSGKTTFVRAAAEALGYTGPVTSPSYVLAHRYEGGPVPIAHLDLQRLEAIEGEDDTLLADHLSADAVAFIEWPEVAEPALLSVPVLRVQLAHDGQDARLVEVRRDG